MTAGRARGAHETPSLTYSFFTLIFLLLGPTAPGVTGVECTTDVRARRHGRPITNSISSMVHFVTAEFVFSENRNVFMCVDHLNDLPIARMKW